MPDDLIWTNQGLSSAKQLSLKLISLIVSIIVVLVCGLVIIYIKHKEASIKYSPEATNDKLGEALVTDEDGNTITVE